ncbi:hypothetical protein CEV31_3108 [Brucella thiophenivorans]|uniref:Uncharacterized protein n=1 Tax=Brucella thiophenivorans TaxID=571255 RepID=A0A256FKD1_9HYPH|nr:hypothetical protein CEV31_3108 [Brucella thiophenivorans]
MGNVANVPRNRVAKIALMHQYLAQNANHICRNGIESQ